MLPEGSKSIIKLISFLDNLDLLIFYSGNSETLMWEFATPGTKIGQKLEVLDAKLYTDEIYRAREEERGLQEVLGRIKGGYSGSSE
jgi:hypothetical protein